MQVQINIKSAAARLKQFVASCGGQAKHGESLEVLAQLCGFASYRAFQAAVTQADAPAKPAPSSLCEPLAPVEGRSLESPEHVVLTAPMVDWQLDQNPAVSEKECPLEHRRPYDFVVERAGSQFRVLVKPSGVGLDNFEGQPLLDMLVEINQGMPCVHLTNDPADAMLLAVFGHQQGLVLRHEQGQWVPPKQGYRLPLPLKALRDAVTSENERGYCIVLDTAEKYAENPGSSISA